MNNESNPAKNAKILRGGVLLLTILAVLVVSLFFCFKKGPILYVDEVWSYGLANSEYAPWMNDVNGDGNIIGDVLTRDDLWNYVTVNSDDSFNYGSVYYNQTNDNHPPLFYWMLHTVSSIFPNSFSKWIGLVPNLCMYALTLLLLYLTAKRLFGSAKCALATVLLYGLSPVGLSAMLMIRMYMMMTMFTVLLAYLIVCIIQTPKWYLYPLIMVTIWLGTMTQYYFAVYAFFVCAAADILFLAKRRFRDFFAFSSCAVLGILFVYLAFPACIDHLFNSGKVTGSGIVHNMLSVSALARHLLSLVKRNLAVAAVSALSLLYIIINLLTKKGKIEGWFNSSAFVIIVPAVLSAVIIPVISSDTYGIRYLYFVCPALALIAGYMLLLCGKSYSLSANGRFPKKTALICAALLVAGASVAQLAVEPEWIDKDSAGSIRFTKQHANAACVYLIEDNRNHDAITVDIPHLLAFSEIYVVDDENSIPGYLEQRGENNEELVLYVSKKMELYDNIEGMTAFAKELGYDNCELFHTYNASSIYLLTH